MKTNYDKTIYKLINVLLENTNLMFRETEQFKKLIEIHDKKSNDYEKVLCEHDRSLVNDYLTALNELTAAEIEFVYIQGYKDCVSLLQRIGIL